MSLVVDNSVASALNDPRWQAVAARDAAFDGRFVYSVRTTGVYCRPACPARRAKPENVSFHATWQDAEQAGFRACLRCRPDAPSSAERSAATIAALCRQIEEAEECPTLADLARSAGMGRFHLHRLFKSVTGITPKAYSDAHRARRVRATLADARNSVTSAIYDSGFNSSGRFYETSNAVLGMTPTALRAGGAGIDIRFAVGECVLGTILIARSDKGVCAILLGDDPDALTRDLQDRFPNANFIGDDPEFERHVAQVVGFLESPALGLDLPLDVRGTAFQHRVWQALREIPVGETASYTAIANRIGAPTSARAVAQACGANPVALAIPCHRVVRTDGALSGYRWGIERKRALLAREAGISLSVKTPK